MFLHSLENDIDLNRMLKIKISKILNNVKGQFVSILIFKVFSCRNMNDFFSIVQYDNQFNRGIEIERAKYNFQRIQARY